MAHYYGGVHGRRGQATRLGDTSSGMHVFANGWGSGISAVMSHWNGKDNGRVTFNSGSGYGGGSLTVGFNDMDTVIEALGTDDKKIRASVERIRKEFDKIEERAPEAIRLYERRQKIKSNREAREQKAKEERLAAIRDSITDDEVRNYITMIQGYDMSDLPEWYDADRAKDDICRPYGHIEPYRAFGGNLIVTDGNGFKSDVWDLTEGKKLEFEGDAAA